MLFRLILLALLFGPFNGNSKESFLKRIFKRTNKPSELDQQNHGEVEVRRAVPVYDESNPRAVVPTENINNEPQEKPKVGFLKRLFTRTPKTKTAWTEKDEEEFSRWVQAIGESNCRSANACLNSSANYLKSPGEQYNIDETIDCGRLPYLLRGYYAQKKGLPFAVTSEVTPLGPLTDVEDPVRYTPDGNGVSERDWVNPKEKNSFDRFIASVDRVNTRVYRVPSNHENNDFYPVRADSENIKAGTIFYDTSGHVGMVYSVDTNGVIHTLNAHPDGSFSRKVFNQDNFPWSSKVENGGGFKRFRPIVSHKGRTQLASNSEIEGYSLEQYDHKGSEYYNFIAQRMGTTVDPTENFSLTIKEICSKFRERIQSVERATQRGMPNLDLPNGRMPPNIYGASGDWEEYSTPSADLRLNSSIARLTKDVREAVDRNRNYKAAFKEKFKEFESWEGCQFSYTNSEGNSVRLGLRDVFDRAFNFSFDPYHCPELRMGAPLRSAEMKTCKSSQEKLSWYQAQAPLRNRTEKDVNLFTGFDLYELNKNSMKLGPPEAPDARLLNILF